MGYRQPLVVALAFALACVVGAADDQEVDDPSDCSDALCSCEAEDVCLLDCGDLENCSPWCDQAGECTIRCDGTCYPACTNTTSCNIECGDGCWAQCSDTQTCMVTVGYLSTVECNNSHCIIYCTNDCIVQCPGGGCDITCAPGLIPTGNGCVSD